MADEIVFDQAVLHALFQSEDGPVGKDLQRRALQVDNAAKRNCPVDTGRLRSSISNGVTRDSRGLAGVVGTNVEYAAYVELGTSRMPAQPFLRPALGAAS